VEEFLQRIPHTYGLDSPAVQDKATSNMTDTSGNTVLCLTMD